MKPVTFDPIWEQKYAAGHNESYPWDTVVSFVFRHAPRNVPRSHVKILEVGCGTGPNLWFAAREGFSVFGVDGSESAIEAAKDRMARDNLTAELHVADFSALPFEDATFDLVIDRAALTCCSRSRLPDVFAEIVRVTKTGGRFLFNPYADSHSSFSSGKRTADGTTIDIQTGTLVGVGQISFFSKREIVDALEGYWRLESLVRREDTSMTGPSVSIHGEWLAVAERA